VIGELALGQMRQREKILGNLKLLPRAQEAKPEELLVLIEDERLYGKGLSIVDVQIAASALISGAGLFTRDKALSSAAKTLGIAVF
jgi:predicted nucleic acid-binding protein